MNNARLPQKSLLKVVVLGDAGVGKTSVVKQYVNGKFDKEYKPTIGADFLTTDVTIPDRRLLQLQIWDTAGQERFKSIAVSFYRGADACVLVYDICDIKTFQNLEMWMREFLENVGTNIDKDDFPFVVLGNKADKSEEMMVSKSRAEAWCKTKKNVSLFETSALSKKNLKEAFNHIAIAASGCVPSVSLVDVKDLGANPEVRAESDDGKALEEEPEQEPEDEKGNAIDAEERKYVVDDEDEEDEDEPLRAEIRRESPEESSKRGRKKPSRHKNKIKSSRRSSVHGSHASSKHSHKDNQSSRTSSKNSKKDSRYEHESKAKRSKRRNSVVDSIDSKDREDAQSRSGYDSPRNCQHSRRSTPYRHGRMDSIRLDDDDRYSTGSESPLSCCGI